MNTGHAQRGPLRHEKVADLQVEVEEEPRQRIKLHNVEHHAQYTQPTP
ncbi:Uncharacterised protein [Dermatophilus congolensis]|uniref:Uncharacterized protein n=1 Tax=Dermatophilus congolensis TaxID=1863 RepID=A0A239VJK1_9MICO|nr:Uncharacterised protein [Dermatophilus congolensis]